MTSKPLPTLDRLRELLEIRGPALFWRVTRPGVRAGSRAGAAAAAYAEAARKHWGDYAHQAEVDDGAV